MNVSDEDSEVFAMFNRVWTTLAKRTSISAFFVLFVSFVVPSVVCSARVSAAERKDRPNIVLIVADDLGRCELGCYGQKIIQTPHIDELAREGMRFTEFYSGAPVCAPARCMLMTGKHSGHAAIRDNHKPGGMEELREKYQWETPGQQPLPRNEVTIAELLQQAGYVTGAIGKWGLGHVGTTGDPNRQGFDLFYGFTCQTHAHNHYPRFLWRNDQKESQPGNSGVGNGETHSQDQFTKEALSFIRVHRDEPFFLYLPFIISHLSIQVPEASLKPYAGKIPEAPYNHKDNYLPHPTPRAGYAAMVSHLDAAVGKIVDLIDELGLADNTLILFTSDNGPTYDRLGGADSDFFNSAGPLRGRKGSVYEGGIRVPLIARWPGRIQGDTESDHVAAFWDMMPTICNTAGIAPPERIDGISFEPTLLGSKEQPTHTYLYWEFPNYGGQQAVRAGDWKALRTEMQSGNRTWQLYNLNDDLSERHDVAAQHPKIVARLEKYASTAHLPSKLFPLLPEDRSAETTAAGRER